MARHNRLPWIAWVFGLGGSTLFGMLAYIALTERSISLGNRLGISHSEGTAAAITGFLLLGAALFCVGVLFNFSRVRLQAHLLLTCLWLVGVAAWMVLAR